VPARYAVHGGTPQDDRDFYAPGVLAALEAAEHRGLQIEPETVCAMLAAASGFPDPRLFVAEGKAEVPSIRPGSFGQRAWQLLTGFHGPGHGRIEYFTTLAWTKDLKLLWYTSGSPHDDPPGTRIVHLMSQLGDAVSALGREHDALGAAD
jgi:hypothetical protein